MKGLGWIPQRPDPRDFPIEKLHAKFGPPVEIPQAVDLRPKFPVPCYDQGELGSCTANATVGAAEFLGYRDAGKYIYRLSRLALYYDVREYEGDPGDDRGAELRDVIKVGAKTGLCGEWAWPYNVGKFAVKPPPFAYRNAATHLFTEYYSIPPETRARDVLAALASGYPVIFGFRVYRQFDEIGPDGICPPMDPGGWPIGGHAVLAMGYDRIRKLYLIRNSWGPEWGDHGYFWMPFDYANDPDEAGDFWILHKEAGI
jgi:C1A family cysteine protease